MSDNVQAGDTIRIADDARVNPELRGMLAEVTDVRNWGVLADVPGQPGYVYPVRVSFGEFEVES